MAQAALATAGPPGAADGDLAYRTFTWLSPAHRASDPVHGAAYRIEPYVMAGDVYTQPPYVGRGGWSWYTGSAAWMHRAAVESIFGLRLGPRELSFMPCLPAKWAHAELTLTRDGRTLHFLLTRPEGAPAQAAPGTATRLLPGESLRWTDLAPHSSFVIVLDRPAADPAARA
jgi:cyclic beta-1,2-glucan synthetase